jgi:hypothetical protein
VRQIRRAKSSREIAVTPRHLLGNSARGTQALYLCYGPSYLKLHGLEVLETNQRVTIGIVYITDRPTTEDLNYRQRSYSSHSHLNDMIQKDLAW